jgi:hypothetical protein
MVQALHYEFGREVACSDGARGTLTRVVIDPATRSVTHLVVEPSHRVGMARLVPLQLIEPTNEGFRLRCSGPEFGHLEVAEEAAPLPPGLEFGYAEVGMLDGFGGNGTPPVFVDNVPAGEVEIARGDRVHATDGHIGHVNGLLVGLDGRIGHVLLEEGHLWGRKHLAIPIADVADLSVGVLLGLSKRQVQDLVGTPSTTGD